MKKRLISLLLAMCMILTLLPMTVLAEEVRESAEYHALMKNPFTDVKETDWCYDAVQYVRINGIFNGTSATLFSPNRGLTRGMFVTVLGRMAGVDTAAYEGQQIFEDVDPAKYYGPYVAWAYKHGITSGSSDGKFYPDQLITRQQMAAFFVRYFDAFGVDYSTGADIKTVPADIGSVASYAKDAVLKLWKEGLLNGDGVNFNPNGTATRAQTATLCMRADEAVKTWYKEPGVPSDRVRVELPEKDPSGEAGGSGSSGGSDEESFGDHVGSNVANEVLESEVRFYDGDRLIDTFVIQRDTAPGRVPAVEKSSKEGQILIGYFNDPECTEPFYANDRITKKIHNVYAAYRDMESIETLNFTTFTQMDQQPDLSFRIRRVSGDVAPANAASLAVKDGSADVAIRISGGDDGVYTVSAPAGFNKGCTYELTLAEGWIFDGKAETIRTASFSIAMKEVENLSMSDDIVYIKDTESLNYTVTGKMGSTPVVKTYSVLTADALTAEGVDPASVEGRFAWNGSETIEAGDLLCIYVGVHPEDRVTLSSDNDPTNDAALLDPAVYVKAKSVSGGNVTFVALSEEDQQKLYEVPDLFPFLVEELPAVGARNLGVNIHDMDLSMYETAVGKVEGTVAKAKEKADVGDFVVLYTALSAEPEVSDLRYGRITSYDSATGAITYTACSKQDFLDSMDLYTTVDIQGYDVVSETQRQELESALYAQVSASGFAEEAAYLLADLVTATDNFRNDLRVQDILLTNSEGQPLSDEEIQLLNLGGSFELSDDVKLSVELITGGEQLHFKKGVQLAISVDASFEVEVEEGSVAIDLSATFVQEAMIGPSVKGELTYKEVLGIEWPNGVQVNATVDMMSYTALSFAAEIYTVAAEDEALWTKMQNLAKDPASVLGLAGIPSGLVDSLKTVGDVMDKIDELQNAIDRGTLAADKVRAYTQDINALWNVLEDNNLASREEWEEMALALGKTSVTSDLLGLSDLSEETGISPEYLESVEALLDKYSETVTKETDWVKLVEQEIFAVEVCVAGICIGVETNFVVRADMSIAIGSSLEYEVGKRYSFWFRIGLYTPTAGSDTTDLIDEKFAFQFYVMGKLGVKAGVRAKLYVGIGSKAFASVGIAAELGPYIKLWGFFVYECSKYRPANTQNVTYSERMDGGLFMEFGLYFMLSFEAEALSLFEYSYDFLDEEVPLLNAGKDRYYYDFAYEPATDEAVFVNDDNGDSRDGVTMQLPDEIRALSYMELPTGRRGSQPLDYSCYNMTVSNPNFSITPEGLITVDVPNNIRFMECDLTITYLKGKRPFSDYDMTVTIPLVWTNLALSELREYYTVSVRVGNDSDGYDTVWSKKVLKSQPFDLPAAEEIKEMIGWSDAKYVMAGGYGSQPLTDLAVVENTTYSFKIDYPTYNLTVTGIQNPDGTTRSQTFPVKYGQTFDFSALKGTGTAKAGEAYTKFTNVTTNATVTVGGRTQVIDLTEPVSAKVAAALKSGITATANYVDDSVTAVFTFGGIMYDADTDIVKDNEVTVKLKKGTVPSTADVVKAVEEYPGDEGIIIASIEPAVGPISQSTNYMVACVRPDGARNDVHFDLQNGSYNGGTTVPSMDKLAGSLLVNLPVASRDGYDFDGWFTEPKNELSNQFGGNYGANNGENALTQTVPRNDEDDNYTLHAQWTPKTYTVTFDMNGGDQLFVNDGAGSEVKVASSSSDKWKVTMVHDHAYGNYYAHTESAVNLRDLSESAMYVGLPVAYNPDTRLDPDGLRDDENMTINVGVTFGGWYCDLDKDGVWFEDGELVTDETIVKITEDTTLKARWRTKVAIHYSVFTFEEKTVTYDGSGYAPERTFNGGQGSYYYLDAPSVLYKLDYPSDGYTFDYKFNSGLHEYVRKGTLPYVAGLYDVRVEREADDNFARMSWYNPYRAKLEIKKATSSLSGSLSVSTHGRAAIASFATSSITNDFGVGAIEYRVDGGDWSSMGVFYDLSAGSHTMEVRLGEGMNYKASDVVDSETFNIASGSTNNITYKIVIKTESKGSTGGTDASIYAAVGSTSVHLDKSGYDDFEQGAEDSYAITVPADYDMSDGKITVNIRLDQAGEGWVDGWHWEMKWIRLEIYDGSTRIYQSDNLGGTEYDEDEENHDYTFSGVGRGIVDSSCGLSKSGNTITINSTISDNYHTDYDPLNYPNAPRFEVYFSNSIFNKYITRVDLYTYTIDAAGLEAAMEEYRIEDLVLNYGINYATSKGIMGATDDMRTYTYHYGLTI